MFENPYPLSDLVENIIGIKASGVQNVIAEVLSV